MYIWKTHVRHDQVHSKCIHCTTSSRNDRRIACSIIFEIWEFNCYDVISMPVQYNYNFSFRFLCSEFFIYSPSFIGIICVHSYSCVCYVSRWIFIDFIYGAFGLKRKCTFLMINRSSGVRCKHWSTYFFLEWNWKHDSVLRSFNSLSQYSIEDPIFCRVHYASSPKIYVD